MLADGLFLWRKNRGVTWSNLWERLALEVVTSHVGSILKRTPSSTSGAWGVDLLYGGSSVVLRIHGDEWVLSAVLTTWIYCEEA